VLLDMATVLVHLESMLRTEVESRSAEATTMPHRFRAADAMLEDVRLSLVWVREHHHSSSIAELNDRLMLAHMGTRGVLEIL
jgi:hypothetical protein